MSPVQQATLAHFGLSLEVLCGRSREPQAVYARHVAFYLEREMLGKAFTEIGALYGRDHSTIVLAYRHMVERLAAKDERYTIAIECVAALVKQKMMTKAKQAPAVDLLACPTCGAPVIREMQRQIAELTAKLSAMGGTP